MDHLIQQIKKFPSSPGVYLFKDGEQIVYIGKAKNLKRRGASYLQNLGSDVKVDTIFAGSTNVEYQVTETELEALLLEAQLIQSHQPKFNVLLKSGQPFLYLMVSTGSMPELKIVRNQKQKGTYFGPFLEKGSARKVYDFLIKTFRLKLCKKKIANGCLYYHMGLCAGACRADFDKQAYLERLELAKNSLRQGHRKFLKSLEEQIAQHNQKMEFEQSRQLHGYLEAFGRVFESLEHKPADLSDVSRKDIWVLLPARPELVEGFERKATMSLFVFGEINSALKKKHVFYLPFYTGHVDADQLGEYFLSFYRSFRPPAVILTNFDLGEEKSVFEEFLTKYYKKDFDVSIIQSPEQGHLAGLMRLATIHAQQELEKQLALPKALKQLFKLDTQPHTVDCFDISHKQGMFMVGSCVRFKDGLPDKTNFRHFHIKTVEGQDDYASLREIVGRRYRDATHLPDLILIDGGKGQLNAVQDLFPQAEFASLAKREETVFSKRLPQGRKLDLKSYAGQMLVALRDYAHHFAISFHRKTERTSTH
jgi:excinuclease ABC subunit C